MPLLEMVLCLLKSLLVSVNNFSMNWVVFSTGVDLYQPCFHCFMEISHIFQSDLVQNISCRRMTPDPFPLGKRKTESTVKPKCKMYLLLAIGRLLGKSPISNNLSCVLSIPLLVFSLTQHCS